MSTSVAEVTCPHADSAKASVVVWRGRVTGILCPHHSTDSGQCQAGAAKGPVGMCWLAFHRYDPRSIAGEDK